MSKPYWVLDDVLGVLQWMSCIRTDRLQQSRTSKYEIINSDYSNLRKVKQGVSCSSRDEGKKFTSF